MGTTPEPNLCGRRDPRGYGLGKSLRRKDKGVKEEVFVGEREAKQAAWTSRESFMRLGKEKAKLLLTWRRKSEILRTIFEVGYVSSFLRSTPRSNPYAVSLS
jgi:hypothetical protein